MPAFASKEATDQASDQVRYSGYGSLRPDRALALAAVQAMADSDAIRRGGYLDPHSPAQASTGVVSHRLVSSVC